MGILGCFVLYLLSTFPSWREPIMGDEVTYALLVKGLIHPEITRFFQNIDPGFGLWHPPLYAHVLSLFEKFFVFNELTARTVSFASFLISLVFVYLIAKELFRDDPKKKAIGLFACLLFSLNPLAIRGSLLIDMDGTLLNAAVLGFIYYFSRKEINNVCAGVLLALCLWIKFATPIFLLGFLVIYWCIARDFNKVIRIFKVILWGIVLFSISWFFYSMARQISFWSVFEVPWTVARGFFEKSKEVKSLALYARNLWAVVMWCSPSFILLGFFGIVKTLFEKKSYINNKDIIFPKSFVFYGVVVFVAYLLIGGVTHSFPKYHYAIMPVFVIAISSFVIKNIDFSRKLMREIIFLISGLVIFNIFFVGDPLYTINYALKENIALYEGHGARSLVTKELFQVALILFTIVIAYLAFKMLKRPKAWLLSFLVTAVACNIALTIVQARAPYNTVYVYGACGVREAAEFVQSKTRLSDKICAPLEILLLANKNLSSYLTAANLRSKDKFLNMLENENINCVVYGISGNTVEQYVNVFNKPEVRSFLAARYEGKTIGSYTIWIKR